MTSFRRNLFTLVAGLSLISVVALPACKDANRSTDATEARGTGGLSSKDDAFFGKAAQTGMAEMQAATLAGERSQAADVKKFAAMMTTDHGANSKLLQALASRKGVSLPAQLDKDHQAMLDKLQQTPPEDFDKAYASAMVDGHKKAVDLFKEVSEDSKDADVNSFAKTSLPTLEHHLDMAKALAAAH